MTVEQAFNNMHNESYNEVNDLREHLVRYLNGDMIKEEIIRYFELKECGICGHIDLEENMHENEDGIYCDCCWEAR